MLLNFSSKPGHSRTAGDHGIFAAYVADESLNQGMGGRNSWNSPDLSNCKNAHIKSCHSISEELDRSQVS